MADEIVNNPLPHLVVGLGNPGPRYLGNRHNLGFRVVEGVAAELGAGFQAESPRYLAADATGGPRPCVLIKPLTYMNLSGEAVTAWRDAQNPDLLLDPSRLLVVGDDLALPLGSLRLRGKGSSGGQNGLASIIESLGTEAFARLRLGIDGTEGALMPEQWADYVLEDFAPEEQETAALLVERGVQAVLGWLEMGAERAASRFNGRVEPPTSE
jgi:PTH1 family peptidyl-tRNA hydrolase